MLSQYAPYYRAVTNLTPWLQDDKPVVEGPRLGFICREGHRIWLTITKMQTTHRTEYTCEVCARDPMEVYARKWIEAKMAIKLQLCAHNTGAVYMSDGSPLKIAIGDQLAPVTHPRILLPACADDSKLDTAWARYQDEIKLTDN